MTKNPKNSPCSHQTSSEGNFGTGVFVGVVAGAVGMFLFGTDRGQELIDNLKRELERELSKENSSGETPLEQTRTLIAKVVTETKNVVTETRQAAENVTQPKGPLADDDDEFFPKFQRKH